MNLDLITCTKYNTRDGRSFPGVDSAVNSVFGSAVEVTHGDKNMVITFITTHKLRYNRYNYGDISIYNNIISYIIYDNVLYI